MGTEMDKKFEDHCWQDVIPANVLEIYAKYEREIFVGPAPALLAIDLYELVYGGGPLPVNEVIKTHPSSCGEHAYAAIDPTKRLFAAARAAGIPIFYTTGDSRPDSRPHGIGATKRATSASSADAANYAIRPEFKPQPGDVVITKQRASGFFATPLMPHLTKLGVRTVIICGESTSGCVRASAVDAHSHGLHTVLVEECCFDRSEISHKVSLFDLHHKYADVMKVDEVVTHLQGIVPRPALRSVR
jgi:nicotinamidase-related amidase